MRKELEVNTLMSLYVQKRGGRKAEEMIGHNSNHASRLRTQNLNPCGKIAGCIKCDSSAWPLDKTQSIKTHRRKDGHPCKGNL